MLTMRLPTLVPIAPIYALLVACSNGQPASKSAADSGATSPAAVTTTPAANPDPDQTANGTGVPAGYVGQTDESSKAIADAKYTAGPGGAWEVQTGPAHILYSAKDTASGSYTLHAEIDQLQAPHHPEAYGVFFGGQNLAEPNQRYTYFIVRGNGMYAIKVRDGADARTVVDFTANPNVPTADAAGRAAYAIAVQVAADSVHFLVNEKPVAAVAKGKLAVAGIAGLRINHNLHVTVKPVAIAR
jgi:hypothetical protein